MSIRHGLLLLGLSACVPAAPMYDQAPPTGEVCTTALDVELCSEALTAVATPRDDGGVDVTVEADVVVPGAQLGMDETTLSLSLSLPAAPSLPYEVPALQADVPLGFTCIRDIVHGDHCHYMEPEALACTVPVDEASPHFEAVVDAWDGETLTLRFRGTFEGERPPCCEHTCDVRTEPTAEADPKGPYAVAGAVSVVVGAASDREVVAE